MLGASWIFDSAALTCRVKGCNTDFFAVSAGRSTGRGAVSAFLLLPLLVPRPAAGVGKTRTAAAAMSCGMAAGTVTVNITSGSVRSAECFVSPPGTSDPGTSDPGTSDPGTSEPGTSEPGTSEPGVGCCTGAAALGWYAALGVAVASRCFRLLPSFAPAAAAAGLGSAGAELAGSEAAAGAGCGWPAAAGGAMPSSAVTVPHR